MDLQDEGIPNRHFRKANFEEANGKDFIGQISFPQTYKLIDCLNSIFTSIPTPISLPKLSKQRGLKGAATYLPFIIETAHISNLQKQKGINASQYN